MIRYILIWSILLTGCQSKPGSRQVERAFYHWQTELNLSNTEQVFLGQSQITKLYVKFFDVDWDARQKYPVPQADIQYEGQLSDTIQIIPTIFITNRSLSNLPDKAIEDLTNRIYNRILDLGSQFKQHLIPEIQIDCDWTIKTREKYFRLLSTLKKLLPPDQVLSATIRLHQIAYPDQTGIPPIEKGILMFYNMGKLRDWETPNSLLDPELGLSYLDELDKYPLSLDLALPIFRWGVLFRQGRMIKLINNLEIEELRDPSYFKPMTASRYEVQKSTYLKGYYLYQGDWIRLEASTPQQLELTSDKLKAIWPDHPLVLSFYHLDSTTLKHWHYDFISSLYQKFEMVE